MRYGAFARVLSAIPIPIEWDSFKLAWSVSIANSIKLAQTDCLSRGRRAGPCEAPASGVKGISTHIETPHGFSLSFCV